MEIAVLLEPCEGGGFRAKTGAPFDLCAEGATEQEAARQLAVLIDALMASGRLVTTLTIANRKAVLSPVSSFPADNLYQTDWAYRELQEAIAENRRQDEAANP